MDPGDFFVSLYFERRKGNMFLLQLYLAFTVGSGAKPVNNVKTALCVRYAAPALPSRCPVLSPVPAV